MSAGFGAFVIGDEILVGKRQDKHFPWLIGALAKRGLRLAWCEHLGDEPERITLERVTAPFVEQGPRRCLLGTGACGENPGCPVHERWLPVAVASDRFFHTTTIADLTTRGPGALALQTFLSPSSPNPSSHT